MFIVVFVVFVFLHFFVVFRLIALVDMFFLYSMVIVWCSLVVQVSCCLEGSLITLKKGYILWNEGPGTLW